MFRTERIARSQAVSFFKTMVYADRTLVAIVVIVSNVHIIVAVVTCPDNRGSAHHRAAARHSLHIHHHVRIGHGNVVH